MRKEQETENEKERDRFKQSVFAHAFSAFDRQDALKQYYETFEKPEEEIDFDYEEFVPETEDDLLEMLNAARRAGAIT